MERPRLSLSMIVRNSAHHLQKTLDSIREHVDEIVIVDTEPGGSQDGTREIALNAGARIEEFAWVDDFAKARNFALAQCSEDLVLWLDDDDIVINAQQFTAMARAAFSLGNTEIWADYDYIHDRHGNCRSRHPRERFIDKRIYEWRGRVHEVPCAKHLSSQGQVKREFGYVKHTSLVEDELGQNERVKRNLKIFQDMEKAGEIDHRYQYLYANILLGIGKFEDALGWYHRYASKMQRSGHHYAALCGAARCLAMLQKPNECRSVLGDAVLLYPRNATAYMLMAKVFHDLHDWGPALDWAEEAIQHQDGVQYEMIYDPADIQAVPHMVKVGAYIERAEFDKAEEHLKAAQVIYPDNEGLLAYQRILDVNRVRVKGMEAYDILRTALAGEGREDDIEQLAEIVPAAIRAYPHVQRHRRRPARSGRPTVGIFCSADYEVWGPKSIETGIGGSETAVIQMSKELDRQGFEVTVYAYVNAKTVGVHDNVRWNHYVAYNPKKDHHDVMLWWRDPRGPMQYGMNANVSIVWAHDVLQENAWLYDAELLYDRVFVLSDYHRDLYRKRLPDELLYVTRNGTDPALWATPVNSEYRKGMVYSSCPSRGLLHILREWSFIKDEVPDATLDIYYGWNKAFELAMAHHPEAQRLYTEIEKLRRAPGITWHGRVGKQELAIAYAKAKVWAYPCDFPEISCITAMEAQIHGAMPVIRNHAALSETVKYGTRLDLDMTKRGDQVQYAAELVKALRQPDFPEREEMISWARQTYSWEAVAKDWARLFREMLAACSEPRVIQPGELPRSRVFSQVS